MLGVLTIVAALRSLSAALLDFGVHSFVPALTAVLGLSITAIAFYAGLGLLLEDVRGVLLPMTFRKKERRRRWKEIWSIRSRTCTGRRGCGSSCD